MKCPAKAFTQLMSEMSTAASWKVGEATARSGWSVPRHLEKLRRLVSPSVPLAELYSCRPVQVHADCGSPCRRRQPAERPKSKHKAHKLEEALATCRYGAQCEPETSAKRSAYLRRFTGTCLQTDNFWLRFWLNHADKTRKRKSTKSPDGNLIMRLLW